MKLTNDNGLAAPHDQPVKTNTQLTNNLDFATDTDHSKAESSLRAQLALAGHAVHPLTDGSYLVCKYGYTHHAIDLEGLQAFSVRLGVSRD